MATPVIKGHVWSSKDLPRSGEAPTWSWHVEITRDGQPWIYVGTYRLWVTALRQAFAGAKQMRRTL